jgi:pimeloyl-ACP methyl ester carboxylesterase
VKWYTEIIDISADGATLHGEILLPNGEGPFPGAALCHGIASGHRAMRPSAKQLVRRGVATIIFDFRGHGQSGGILDSDLAEDVITAIKYLRGHTKVDPNHIALVGHSMGAIAALYAAAREDIQALVFLSSPAEINGQFAKHWASLYPRAAEAGSLVIEFPRIGPLPQLGRLQGMISRLWMWTHGYRLRINLERGQESWEKLNPLTNIQNLGAFPKLFVHCRGDKRVPYDVAIRLHEKAGSPKMLLLSKGGFHTAPLFPGRLREKWIAWLVSTLT